jgi:hypothetical protein
VVAQALLAGGEEAGEHTMILALIGGVLLTVLYAAAVPITYYAAIYELTDEEGIPDDPHGRRYAILLSAVWPLTWLFFLCICLGAAILNGVYGLNQAIDEARASRRPWRRRGNLIILERRIRKG